MRGARITRIAALLGLAVMGGGSGCTHYHYYGAAQPMLCDPPVTAARAASNVPYGSVCEVPQSGAAIMAEAPRRGELIVSRPQGVSAGRRVNSRFAWHKPDPEGLATTRVEGGVDESITR